MDLIEEAERRRLVIDPQLMNHEKVIKDDQIFFSARKVLLKKKFVLFFRQP